MGSTIKEIRIACKGEKLWQVGNNRPRKYVSTADTVRKHDFIKVGSMRVEKKDSKKIVEEKSGYFDEINNP